MREIRMLTGGPRQYHLTIPKTIVYRLFEEEADGRYYVRINIEGDRLVVSPMASHPEKRILDPLEELERLQREEEGEC